MRQFNFSCSVLPRNWRVMCHDSGAIQRRPSLPDLRRATTVVSSERTAGESGMPTNKRIRR